MAHRNLKRLRHRMTADQKKKRQDKIVARAEERARPKTYEK
jgi:hypothetical protein